MKRTLTGIAAAAVVLGSAAPMAFAATGANGWNYNVASQLPIVLNGSVLSNPYELTAKDSGNTTAYFPVYYFNKALSQIGSGYSATWDGVTHTWAVKAPNVDASKISIAGGVGTGNTTITVNGTVVKKINTGAAKDPAGGGMTTYFPAYYIDEIFNQLGAKVSFSGQTGLAITSAVTTVGSGLSAITVSGESSGDGSSASPAVSLSSSKAITVSSTLTNAAGNPVANTAVQFEISEYGTKPSNMPLPTVTNASGTVISGTSNSDYEAYTAYTDSNGQASLTISGPAGQTYAYQVVATAPYQAGGVTVSSAPAYTEFVANNEAAITPFASQSNAFGATMGKAVPITVALPPNSDGSARTNVLVTLMATPTGNSNGSPYFTNSSGADLGSTIQVSTNASGIAQAWLNDANSETVQVQAQIQGGLGLNNPQSSYINFAQSGVGSRINNYSITSKNLSTGQNVTVSGQLVDAAGNAIANGQVLVVGNDTTNSGDFGYVTTANSKSTVTDFPNVGNVSGTTIPVAQGLSASSNTGDVVTADSNGNFSFVVTDTHDTESATFSIYPVSNGIVASNSALQSDTITFTAGTTLSSISLAATDYQADNNTYTSLTGLSANNHSFTTVYLDPQNAAGNPLKGQSLNYNVNVDNGGTVEAIATVDSNGNAKDTLQINQSNPGLSALSIQESYSTDASGNPVYTFSVPGQGTQKITSDNPDLVLYVYNGNTGATKLTVNSGSATSTADVSFGGGAPAFVQSFAPGNSTLSSGQTEKLTFQLQDNQGNAVPNGIATIATQDGNNPLWITAVNGVALAQNENMAATGNGVYNSEPTPIPLGTVATASTVAPITQGTVAGQAQLGYSSVNIPGVVSWMNGNTKSTSGSNHGDFTVYSDASGNVTLTVQGQGTSFYNGDYNLTASTNGTANTNESVWTYQKHDYSGVEDWQLWIGRTAPTFTDASNYTTQSAQLLGTIGVGSNASAVSVGSFSYAGAKTIYDNNSTQTGSDATVGTSSLTFPVDSGSTTPTGGTYTLSGPTGYSGVSVNSSNGTVTVNNGATVGTYTVTYSLLGSKTTATFAVSATTTVDAGKSTAVASSSSVTSGGTLAVTGKVLDAAGNPISGVAVTAKESGANTDNALTAVTTSLSDGSYVIAIPAADTKTAGSNTVTVTAGATTITQTATFTVTTGAASKFTVSPATATVTAAGTKTATITATVVDANGNVVSGATVNWAVTAGTDAGTLGTLSAASSKTDATGKATVVYTEGTPGAAGQTDKVTATVTGATASAAGADTATITDN